MKRWWETQSARINALSMRERVFLFLSAMACGMALADVLWLSPAQTVHKQLTQRFDKQSAELQRARTELTTVAPPVDASKVVRDDVSAVQIRLAAVNENIKAVLPPATEVAPLAQVLVHLLHRHAGLTLVGTASMAPEVASTATPAGLTRQGVALTVSGPYPELARYVQTLEKALPHVRWGVMQLKSEKLPPELTLQLFLVGVQP